MATPDSLLTEALDAIQDSSDEKSLESLRVQYIGKKGEVTAQLKALGQLPADERPAAGERINVVKRAIDAALAARKTAIVEQSLNAQLAAVW